MAEDRYEGSSSNMLFFLLGGLTGAAIALLYAPRPGRETREMLSEQFGDAAERGRQLKEQMVARSRELMDEAGEYVDRQREGIDTRRERLSAAIEAGRQASREEKAKM